MKRRLFLFGSLALVLAAGCGSGGPATGEVSGTVLRGGQPLPSGTVTFVGADGKRAPTAISPEGKYRVSGIAVGPARITVVAHAANPFTKSGVGPTRTTPFEVRRGEQEHDILLDP